MVNSNTFLVDGNYHWPNNNTVYTWQTTSIQNPDYSIERADNGFIVTHKFKKYVALDIFGLTEVIKKLESDRT